MKQIIRSIFVVATSTVLAASPMLAGAGVEIGGNLVMDTKQTNSPTTALSIGAGSQATARVNSLRDGKVGGNVTMTVNQKSSPTTSLAIGAGSKATAEVNAVGR